MNKDRLLSLLHNALLDIASSRDGAPDPRAYARKKLYEYEQVLEEEYSKPVAP